MKTPAQQGRYEQRLYKTIEELETKLDDIEKKFLEVWTYELNFLRLLSQIFRQANCENLELRFEFENHNTEKNRLQRRISELENFNKILTKANNQQQTSKGNLESEFPGAKSTSMSLLSGGRPSWHKFLTDKVWSMF